MNSISDKIWTFFMKCGALTGCHQKAERSFFIKRYQLPVCARCTGIILAKLFSMIFVRKHHLSGRIGLLLIIPMVIDGLLQYKYRIESNNKRRVITGFLAGFSISVLKLQFLKNVINNRITR